MSLLTSSARFYTFVSFIMTSSIYLFSFSFSKTFLLIDSFYLFNNFYTFSVNSIQSFTLSWGIAYSYSFPSTILLRMSYLIARSVFLHSDNFLSVLLSVTTNSFKVLMRVFRSYYSRFLIYSPSACILISFCFISSWASLIWFLQYSINSLMRTGSLSISPSVPPSLVYKSIREALS